MNFRTFLRQGVEVLHVGMQRAESNAWPAEYWRTHPGRWRLFTPGIDEYLNAGLAGKSFGASIENFVLLLEVADFAAWGEGPAFSPAEGYTSYSPKARELRSVGKLNWPNIEMLTAKQQLQAYRVSLLEAVERVGQAKRKPRDFNLDAFSAEVSRLLSVAKVSELSRSAWVSRQST